MASMWISSPTIERTLFPPDAKPGWYVLRDYSPVAGPYKTNEEAQAELSRLQGKKSMSAKTKAMGDEVVAEVETPDVDAAVDVMPDEPMGAQLLRRIHENCLLLMEEYDSHLKLQDHPEVKKFAVELLEHLEDTLGTIEDMFGKEYPDLDGPAGSEDLDGGDVDEADSTPEELPTAEESVEGMGLNEKSFRARRSKSYYGYGKKGGSDKLRGRNQAGQIRAIWHEDPEGDYHPNAKALTEDEAAALAEDVVAETQDVEEKSMICRKDMDTLNGAAGFLNEAATYQGEWGDDHRSKAAHWHKQVGPLGAMQEEIATNQDEPVPGEMGQKSEDLDDEMEKQEKALSDLNKRMQALLR